MFRCDFVWNDKGEKLAVEVDGGTWMNGRHSRGKGYDSDCEKLAELQIAGWTVIKITETHLKNGKALEWTQRALGLI